MNIFSPENKKGRKEKKMKRKTQKRKEKIIKKIIEYIVGIIVLSIFFLMIMYGFSISPTIVK